MTESELLFTHILKCQRHDLYLKKELGITKGALEFAGSVLRRRMNREPIQYILGSHEFMGIELKVNPAVFIPRPETEILVEKTISLAREIHNPRILDLCTGSGCIAIALAKNINKARIEATDVSCEALLIAKENVFLNSVDIDLIHSDLFNNIPTQNQYDIIVSNPPYIPRRDILSLQPEVQYEPSLALDAGEDGLYFYRRIAGECRNYLADRGFLVLEIGFNQRKAVEDIIHRNNFLIEEVIKDYSDIDRIIVCRKTDISK